MIVTLVQVLCRLCTGEAQYYVVKHVLESNFFGPQSPTPMICYLVSVNNTFVYSRNRSFCDRLYFYYFRAFSLKTELAKPANDLYMQ